MVFAICCMSLRVSFCSCDFSPFSIAITSLGEERANLSAFRTFVRFVLVWICRFPLHLGVWEGLRFVIVALPGLFSYLFCTQVSRYRVNPGSYMHRDCMMGILHALLGPAHLGVGVSIDVSSTNTRLKPLSSSSCFL